jgi:hypothetical protein
LTHENVLVESDQFGYGESATLAYSLWGIWVAENRLEQGEELGFEDEILQLAVEALGESVLELSEEIDQLVLVVEGLFLAVAQDASQGLDALAVDPGLDFGLDCCGDAGDGVGGGSASEEGFEGVVAVGFVEGVDESLKVGEVLGEGGKVWVLGEDGVGLGLQLEQSVNGGGRVQLGRVGTRVCL